MPPFAPQYDPEQIAAVQAYERKAASRSTPGTWIVAGLIVVAVVAWVAVVVTRSHHTSVARPDAFMSAAPRSMRR